MIQTIFPLSCFNSSCYKTQMVDIRRNVSVWLKTYFNWHKTSASSSYRRSYEAYPSMAVFVDIQIPEVYFNWCQTTVRTSACATSQYRHCTHHTRFTPGAFFFVDVIHNRMVATPTKSFSLQLYKTFKWQLNYRQRPTLLILHLIRYFQYLLASFGLIDNPLHHIYLVSNHLSVTAINKLV